MDDTTRLISTRGASHGDFRTNGRVSQQIKQAMHETAWWPVLPPYQKEALDLIATKISRILSGNSCFSDHWEDIAGYARLVVKEIRTHGQGAEPNASRQLPRSGAENRISTSAADQAADSP